MDDGLPNQHSTWFMSKRAILDGQLVLENMRTTYCSRMTVSSVLSHVQTRCGVTLTLWIFDGTMFRCTPCFGFFPPSKNYERGEWFPEPQNRRIRAWKKIDSLRTTFREYLQCQIRSSTLSHSKQLFALVVLPEACAFFTTVWLLWMYLCTIFAAGVASWNCAECSKVHTKHS